MKDDLPGRRRLIVRAEAEFPVKQEHQRESAWDQKQVIEMSVQETWRQKGLHHPAVESVKQATHQEEAVSGIAKRHYIRARMKSPAVSAIRIFTSRIMPTVLSRRGKAGKMFFPGAHLLRPPPPGWQGILFALKSRFASKYRDILIFGLAERRKVWLVPQIIMSSYIFSSESVGEGHPDKVSDSVSDSILDACLEQDPKSRVACETLVKSNQVYIAGEITTTADLNYEKIVREAIREIGYVNDDDVFHADHVFVTNALTRQSPDIAQGVDEKAAEGKSSAEQGAGDQGLMFGYACDETPELMPAPIMYAHRLGKELTRLRKAKAVDWLRPDAKSQVSIRYVDDKPVAVTAVVISTQHAASVSTEEIRKFVVENVIKKVIPAEMMTDDTEILINPTGRFVLGGPAGDAGLTGRKIIVDTYGGSGHHGGGAFSGKDPSKVDRSAAYMTRWAAKNIVAAKLAQRAELQVAYAIGHPEPVSISVNTFGTGTAGTDEELAEAVAQVFSFKPADIVTQLDLLRPIYRGTTHYGHFGKDDLPWEQTNRVTELQEAIKKVAKVALT